MSSETPGAGAGASSVQLGGGSRDDAAVELESAVNELLEAAEEISTSTNEISGGAVEQADNLREVAQEVCRR